MSRCSLVYVPYIETGRHVKNNACAVEIKIKWITRKQLTHENTYRDDITNSVSRRLNTLCICVVLCILSIVFIVSNYKPARVLNWFNKVFLFLFL